MSALEGVTEIDFLPPSNPPQPNAKSWEIFPEQGLGEWQRQRHKVKPKTRATGKHVDICPEEDRMRKKEKG